MSAASEGHSRTGRLSVVAQGQGQGEIWHARVSGRLGVLVLRELGCLGLLACHHGGGAPRSIWAVLSPLVTTADRPVLMLLSVSRGIRGEEWVELPGHVALEAADGL
jgi:hypothetical protein